MKTVIKCANITIKEWNNLRLLTIVALLVMPVVCSADAHRNYFETYLKNLTTRLHSSDYPGPISRELAKVALARQSMEDGIDRKSDISVAGISTGGFNKTIVDEVVAFSWLKVGYAYDSEGGRFYQFRGDQANVYSALCIARLFDFYVDRFLQKEQSVWYTAKEVSRAIAMQPDSFELNHFFYNKLQPEKTIEKANRLFGPKHDSVIRIMNQATPH